MTEPKLTEAQKRAIRLAGIPDVLINQGGPSDKRRVSFSALRDLAGQAMKEIANLGVMPKKCAYCYSHHPLSLARSGMARNQNWHRSMHLLVLPIMRINADQESFQFGNNDSPAFPSEPGQCDQTRNESERGCSMEPPVSQRAGIVSDSAAIAKSFNGGIHPGGLTMPFSSRSEGKETIEISKETACG